MEAAIGQIVDSLSRLCGLPPNDSALDLLAGLLLGKAQLIELLQIEPHLRRGPETCPDGLDRAP